MLEAKETGVNKFLTKKKHDHLPTSERSTGSGVVYICGAFYGQETGPVDWFG